MIYVSKTQLNQVEYLIGQSILGNHVLFDVEALRTVFGEPSLRSLRKKTRRARAKGKNPAGEDSYAVEHLIEKLILQPSLAEKRAYLEQMDRTTFEKVVRTYFNIVENNLYEQMEERH